MKKYYSAIKSYDTRKKLYTTYHLVKNIQKLFHRDYSFIWRTNKPTEPCIFMSNHTKTEAPFAWLLQDDNIRVWSLAKLLFYKSGAKHTCDVILKDFKCRKLLYPLVYLLMPILNNYYKGLRPIPVYKDSKIKITFEKTVETLQEGKNVVIFNEQHHKPMNKFLNEGYQGYVYCGYYYYKKTGKLLKFYPTYCAPSIKTIVVGEPIEYNPSNSVKVEIKRITEYITSETIKLAENMPLHEISRTEFTKYGYDKMNK